MPNYTYKAIDAQGKLQTGTLEGKTLEDLADVLKSKGLFLMESKLLTPRLPPSASARATPQDHLALVKPSTKPVPLEALSIFTSEFSIMLKTGLPLTNALFTLTRQQKHLGFKSILSEIHRLVQEGKTLSDTFATFPRVFDSIYLALLSAGEASGSVPAMLERLSAYLSFRRELRSKLQSALLYPLMIMLTGVGVALFLVLFILPHFAEIFVQMDVELPLPTRLLLALSAHARGFWWFYLFVIGGVVWWTRRWLRIPANTLTFERAELRVPVLGTLIRNIVMTRILRTLGALVASGVPILEALRLAGEAASNRVFHNILEGVRKNASQGKGLATALTSDPFFPPMAADMIANAEITGTLPDVMIQISNYYETETELSIRNLLAVMEPLFIVLIGLLVGGVAVSILLPMFKLDGALG